MYIYLHCQNKNKKIWKQNNITKNKITQNAIKVDEVTYRYNWANEKILEDEREEKPSILLRN